MTRPAFGAVADLSVQALRLASDKGGLVYAAEWWEWFTDLANDRAKRAAQIEAMRR